MSIPKTLDHTKALVEKKSKDQELVVQKQVDVVVEEEPLEDIQITQALFEAALPIVKERFQQLGKSMELAILGQPMRVEGGKVFLEIMGSVQEELAEKMKPDVIKIIREITGANRFKIELVMKEEIENSNRVLYTDSDKFARLKELHPALVEFQRIFGLETDF